MESADVDPDGDGRRVENWGDVVSGRLSSTVLRDSRLVRASRVFHGAVSPTFTFVLVTPLSYLRSALHPARPRQCFSVFIALTARFTGTRWTAIVPQETRFSVLYAGT